MKIHIKVKHRLTFWVLALCMMFIIALPFTFIGMALVGDAPFWMWQAIFMFFAGLLIINKD